MKQRDGDCLTNSSNGQDVVWTTTLWGLLDTREKLPWICCFRSTMTWAYSSTVNGLSIPRACLYSASIAAPIERPTFIMYAPATSLPRMPSLRCPRLAISWRINRSRSRATGMPDVVVANARCPLPNPPEPGGRGGVRITGLTEPISRGARSDTFVGSRLDGLGQLK